MAIIGQAMNFHHKFKFVVEIDGFAKADFQKCTGLDMDIAVVEHYEGGSLIPNKSPGRVKYSNLKLERGSTLDRDFYNWAKEVANVAVNAGRIDNTYKRNIDIVQMLRDGTVSQRWRVWSAWPTKFTAGDWDNTSDDVIVESVELTYDFYEVI